ncbi:BTAD domain-containing putative transcriptional regulator [Actinoplanes sp. NPDC000266]
MDILLLGPVTIRLDEEILDAGPPQRRQVLAALAVDAGRTVTAETLIDRVWDEPPDGARRALHSHIARLRPLLECGDGGRPPLIHDCGGYRLDLDVQQVDYRRFRALADRAERPSLGDDDRMSLLEEARALWRGEPLTGLPGHWAAQVRQAWHREYAAATVRWSQACVRAGRASVAIEALRDLTLAHPLDEPVTGALMTALHASGRTAESLWVFAGLRARLSAELGAEPHADLRRLHESILRGEDVAIVRPDPVLSRPAQLQPDVPVFIGRERELASLTAVSRRSREGRPGPAVCVIHGTGGIGKTWLALRWSHLHRERFPDGQLFVNLRGFDPSGRSLNPGDALGGFLSALGVPPKSTPADVDARAALYRSLTAGKRLLVVLDNARSSEQVAPLLPGSPACTVLITSRNTLTGLIVSHGAEPVGLDVLDDAGARGLLTARLGEQRLAEHAAAVTAVIGACGGLPLALGIAASRTAVRPRFALPAVARELGDAGTRLAALEDDPPEAGLRAVLSWSYGALTPSEARILLFTALAPGADVSVQSVAVLCGLTEREAGRALQTLQRYSLLGEYPGGRWRLHDLVRLYLTERAETDLSAGERDAGLRRLLDFALLTAVAGDRILNPSRPGLDFGPMSADVRPLTFDDEAAVLSWMDAEYAGLLAAQELAFRRSWWPRTWQFAWALDTYQRWRGHVLDHVTAWEIGLTAIRHVDDPAGESLALRLSAHALAHASRYGEALDQLDRALTLAAGDDHRPARAQVHRALSRVHDLAGNLQPALEHAIEGLRLVRATGDEANLSDALNGAGWCHARLGQYEPARPFLDEALDLARRETSRNAEAGILDSLGFVASGLGRHRQALAYYHQALAIFAELDFTYMEADVRECLGDNHAALGETAEAERYWRSAHRLYQRQHRAENAERVGRRLGAPPPHPFSRGKEIVNSRSLTSQKKERSRFGD